MVRIATSRSSLHFPDAYRTLSFFGAMSTFVIGEPLGRKKTLIIGVIIM